MQSLSKFQKALFCRNGEANSQIHMDFARVPKIQKNFKKNKVGSLTLPNYYKLQ